MIEASGPAFNSATKRRVGVAGRPGGGVLMELEPSAPALSFVNHTALATGARRIDGRYNREPTHRLLARHSSCSGRGPVGKIQVHHH